MKLATSAIQRSVLAPIGAMTSAYVRPSSGPDSPCRIVLVTLSR